VPYGICTLLASIPLSTNIDGNNRHLPFLELDCQHTEDARSVMPDVRLFLTWKQ